MAKKTTINEYGQEQENEDEKQENDQFLGFSPFTQIHSDSPPTDEFRSVYGNNQQIAKISESNSKSKFVSGILIPHENCSNISGSVCLADSWWSEKKMSKRENGIMVSDMVTIVRKKSCTGGSCIHCKVVFEDRRDYKEEEGDLRCTNSTINIKASGTILCVFHDAFSIKGTKAPEVFAPFWDKKWGLEDEKAIQDALTDALRGNIPPLDQMRSASSCKGPKVPKLGPNVQVRVVNSPFVISLLENSQG